MPAKVGSFRNAVWAKNAQKKPLDVGYTPSVGSEPYKPLIEEAPEAFEDDERDTDGTVR